MNMTTSTNLAMLVFGGVHIVTRVIEASWSRRWHGNFLQELKQFKNPLHLVAFLVDLVGIFLGGNMFLYASSPQALWTGAAVLALSRLTAFMIELGIFVSRRKERNKEE